jgi:hypothetical protein
MAANRIIATSFKIVGVMDQQGRFFLKNTIIPGGIIKCL